MGKSLLYNAKDQAKKLDIFKTINIFQNKDKYEQNIEYNLINIKTNIFNLNKEENKNELNFKNKSTKIDEIVEEMNKIFNDFDKTKIKFDEKNKIMDEEIGKLKDLTNELIKKNKNKIKEKKDKKENAKN